MEEEKGNDEQNKLCQCRSFCWPLSKPLAQRLIHRGVQFAVEHGVCASRCACQMARTRCQTIDSLRSRHVFPSVQAFAAVS